MQRLDVQLEDDLTGGPAAETVTFGVDRRSYEIDLNTKHAVDFRQKLARFIEHARLVQPRRHRSTRTTANRERSRGIREWAKAHGYEIAEHGRLPAEVIADYESAQRDGHRSDHDINRTARMRRAKRRLRL